MWENCMLHFSEGENKDDTVEDQEYQAVISSQRLDHSYATSVIQDLGEYQVVCMN